MKIYRMSNEHKITPHFAFENKMDEPDFQTYYRKPLKKTWKLGQLKWYDEKRKNKLTDIADFVPYLVSERVAASLSKLVGNQAEFLPMMFEGKLYYIINTLQHIHIDDSLDFNLSVFLYIKDKIIQKKGKPGIEDGMPFDVVRFNFDHKKIDNYHIFVLDGVGRFCCFVSEEFKKIIDDNHFTGFKFELIWDDEIDYAALDDDLEKFKRSESYYPVVQNIENPDNSFTNAVQFMKKNMKYHIYSGFPVAKQISKDVDAYLKTGIIPECFKDLNDYAYHLGMCYIDAFCTVNQAHYMEVGDDLQLCRALVADNEFYAFFAMEHIKKVMEGKNENGNDLLFLLEDISKRPHGEKKYMPIF